MRSLVTSFAILLMSLVACSSEDATSGNSHPLALWWTDPHASGTCGNGFCESGESHASCANDCCDADANGACVSVCGNGFCDGDESHASCPNDCCEVGAD